MITTPYSFQALNGIGKIDKHEMMSEVEEILNLLQAARISTAQSNSLLRGLLGKGNRIDALIIQLIRTVNTETDPLADAAKIREKIIDKWFRLMEEPSSSDEDEMQIGKAPRRELNPQELSESEDMQVDEDTVRELDSTDEDADGELDENDESDPPQSHQTQRGDDENHQGSLQGPPPTHSEDAQSESCGFHLKFPIPETLNPDAGSPNVPMGSNDADDGDAAGMFFVPDLNVGQRH